MRRVFFISAVCLATFSAPVYGVKLNDLEDTSIFDSDALYLAELLSLTSSAADPEKSKGFFKGPVASPAETPATKASKKAALKAPVPTAPKVPAPAVPKKPEVAAPVASPDGAPATKAAKKAAP